MATLGFSRQGAGPPLVLLHALGSSRAAWNPVVPALAEHFDVVAVDLPGFGGSPPPPADVAPPPAAPPAAAPRSGRPPPLPPDVEPSPAALAAAVGALLDDLGVDRPAVVGNSVGG